MTATVNATLDGVSLATAVPEALVMNVHRPLVGARRHVVVDVPGKAGSWVFPEVAGDRIITIDLDLQGTSFATRRAAVRALADWADVGAVAPLIFSDESDRYHEAILDEAPDVDEWLIAGTVSLPFRVGPFALADSVSSEPFSGGSAGHFTHTWNITADDNVDLVPIIELHGVGGNLDSPAVTLNGDTLNIIDSFAALAVVTISTVSHTVTSGVNTDVNLTGAYNPLTVRMGRVSGEFGYLVPGSNTLEIAWDGAATSVAGTVYWRRRYR